MIRSRPFAVATSSAPSASIPAVVADRAPSGAVHWTRCPRLDGASARHASRSAADPPPSSRARRRASAARIATSTPSRSIGRGPAPRATTARAATPADTPRAQVDADADDHDCTRPPLAVASARMPASLRHDGVDDDVVGPLQRDRDAGRARECPQPPPRRPSASAAPSPDALATVRAARAAGRKTTERYRPAPGGDSHARPRRPRPAVCSSATIHAPSGAPACAHRTASSLVEATRRQPRGRDRQKAREIGERRRARASSRRQVAGSRPPASAIAHVDRSCVVIRGIRGIRGRQPRSA